MNKKEIAHVLESFGTLLEITGANPFKVRAYHNAARVLEGLAGNIQAIASAGELVNIKGIGKNIAAHIEEIIQTNSFKEYQELASTIPKGVMEMLSISGLGPKKVKALWQKLGITATDELKKSCEDGRVAGLAGFGKKTAEKILLGLAQQKKHEGKFLISEALHAASELVPALDKLKEVVSVRIAGSLRRQKEIIGDVDLLVSTLNHEKVIDCFVSLSSVDRVVAQGKTKSSVVLKNQMQVDLRCVLPEELPYALHYFTGSKEHNTKMRGLAKKRGWKLNEYGLFEGEQKIKCNNEEELFAKFDLQYIPPELREDRGEIEAAMQGVVPNLVEADDIQGVFHCHSTWSDGAATIEEMVGRARELGFSYYGVADHSVAAHYANGLNNKQVQEQFKEIDELNKKYSDIHIFKGIEADIMSDGSMNMSDILQDFDYVVASIHSKFNMSEEEMTARIIKAVQNPHVSMLGHVTGRLLLSREGYPVNLEEVLSACAANSVAIEINANPRRLDLDWRYHQLAKKLGCKIVINPDAHNVEGLQHFVYGVGVARKGWLTKEDILNTESLKKVKQWLS